MEIFTNPSRMTAMQGRPASGESVFAGKVETENEMTASEMSEGASCGWVEEGE